MECRPVVFRKPWSYDSSKRCADPSPPVREAAAGTQTGSVRLKVEHWPSAACFWWQRQQGAVVLLLKHLCAFTECVYWCGYLSFKLLVWNHSSLSPVQTYVDHLAAVKAIAWSPHQHGLLASGGGTADRCIRFWNTLTSQPLQCMDTGSQVCNLAWSKHANELVSESRYTQGKSFAIQCSRVPFCIDNKMIHGLF